MVEEGAMEASLLDIFAYARPVSKELTQDSGGSSQEKSLLWGIVSFVKRHLPGASNGRRRNAFHSDSWSYVASFLHHLRKVVHGKSSVRTKCSVSPQKNARNC